MEEKLDYEDFKPLFGDWAEEFRPFIESKEMYDIYQKLKSERDAIVPVSDMVFRAFACTNPKNVKSIWYLMDPYPRRYVGRVNQATGIAMDCSNSPDGKLQPSLEQFFLALDKTYGKVERTPDLRYLLEQGVMLLNTDLTCLLNKTGSHKGLWDPFQKFFLEEVMRSRPGVVYVLSGKDSERMERYISPFGNHILKIEHPAASAHNKTDWNYKDVFKKVDKLIAAEGKEKVYWDKKVWDAELPF